MPDHALMWTYVDVTRLGKANMRIEIEVVVFDLEGAKAESAAAA